MNKDQKFEENRADQGDKIYTSSTMMTSDFDMQKIEGISVLSSSTGSNMVYLNGSVIGQWNHKRLQEVLSSCNCIIILQSLDSDVVAEISEVVMNPSQYSKYINAENLHCI